MVTIGTLNGGNITITTGGSAPAGHAETWVKYDGDTEWTPISIEGALEGSYDIYNDLECPTNQIPNVHDVVALEIGTDVTSIGNYAFFGCDGLTSVTIPDRVTNIEYAAFSGCSGLISMTFNSFTKDQVKNLTTETRIFGYEFIDDEWTPIEKTITAICTDGSMTIHFSDDNPATITFTDL